MPNARQGDVHWYDFGLVIGAELSGRRPALVISNDDFNRRFGVAIAVPTSTRLPAEEYRRQHVFITASELLGFRLAVKIRRPGQTGRPYRTGVSLDEMDDVLESLLLAAQSPE